MSVIVVGHDQLMIEWAAHQIPAIGVASAFGPARAVGIMTGPKKTDRVLAVVVFHDYQPRYRTCQISMAASSPLWATRHNIREALAFPFLQYGCNLVWVAIPHTSPRVVSFVKAIGFKQEAILADRFGLGTHAVVCRLKFTEYQKIYLKEQGHGEKQPVAAAGA